MPGPGEADLVVTHEVGDGRVTIILRGELELHTAAALRARLVELLAGVRPVQLVVDLSQVTFLDAAGSQVLAWSYKRVTEAGGQLRLTGLSAQAGLRLSQLGLRRVLEPIHPGTHDGQTGQDGQDGQDGPSTPGRRGAAGLRGTARGPGIPGSPESPGRSSG